MLAAGTLRLLHPDHPTLGTTLPAGVWWRSFVFEVLLTTILMTVILSVSAGAKEKDITAGLAIGAVVGLGYDLSAHGSKSLADIPDVEYDLVATMGCGDSCPLGKARRRADRAIPDPKHLPPAEFNAVRDLVRDRVRAVLAELGVECRQLPGDGR